jgi:hypothetical protein
MILQHTADFSNSIRMLCLECYVKLLVFGSGLSTVVCLHQARFVFRAAEQCSHDRRCHFSPESRLIGDFPGLIPPNVCGVDRAFHSSPTCPSSSLQPPAADFPPLCSILSHGQRYIHMKNIVFPASHGLSDLPWLRRRIETFLNKAVSTSASEQAL